jgi:hypothetical protein
MQDTHPLREREHAHGRKGRKAGRLPGARHRLDVWERAIGHLERPLRMPEGRCRRRCPGRRDGLQQPKRLLQGRRDAAVRNYSALP